MGDLQPGLLNLANWTGNVVLPIGAGLILAWGIYQFSKGQELERYVYGALGALMGSGLLRLAEVISQQATDADQYMVMLLTLTAIMLAVSGTMLVGNFLFSDRYIFHLPMNYFLPLVILLVGVPVLMIFKYGKPRGYLLDLLLFHARPQQYCAGTQETQIRTTYLKEEEA